METVKCPLCGRVCHRLKVYNKHHREVHTGRHFKCKFCPQKFTTPANKKKHEHKVCRSDRSPAEAKRQAHNQTPEPEEGEGSDEEMSGNSEDWEYAINLEVPKGKETRGVEHQDGSEKRGGEIQRAQAPIHPPPKASAERQMRGVKVMLKKVPPPCMGRREAAPQDDGGRTQRKARASGK